MGGLCGSCVGGRCSLQTAKPQQDATEISQCCVIFTSSTSRKAELHQDATILLQALDLHLKRISLSR